MVPWPPPDASNLEVEVGAGAARHEGLLERLGRRAEHAVVERELGAVLHVLGQAVGPLAAEHHAGGDGGRAHDLLRGVATLCKHTRTHTRTLTNPPLSLPPSLPPCPCRLVCNA